MFGFYRVMKENSKDTESSTQWTSQKTELSEDQLQKFIQSEAELDHLRERKKIRQQEISQITQKLKFMKVHTKEIKKDKNINWGDKFEILQKRTIKETELKSSLKDKKKVEEKLEKKIIKIESKLFVQLSVLLDWK